MAGKKQAPAKKSSRGGKRKNAGRKPGSVGVVKREAAEAAAQEKADKPINLATLAALARSHTVNAVDTLQKIMMNEKQSASARIQAAGILLDRGYGKAPQQIAISTPDDIELEAETELAKTSRLMADLISRIDGAVGQEHYAAIEAGDGAALPGPDTVEGQVLQITEGPAEAAD